ncbi:hypothetical protein [Methylicorpusculum sp.]|nr:hypothetical protein [Methylicorpusculum sp.]MDO8845250.1 hypothetical protein [Methylicorpusculum sp.]
MGCLKSADKCITGHGRWVTARQVVRQGVESLNSGVGGGRTTQFKGYL